MAVDKLKLQYMSNKTYSRSNICRTYVADIFYTTFTTPRGGFLADDTHIFFVQLDWLIINWLVTVEEEFNVSATRTSLIHWTSAMESWFLYVIIRVAGWDGLDGSLCWWLLSLALCCIDVVGSVQDDMRLSVSSWNNVNDEWGNGV